MADQKLTELTALTALSSDDLLLVTDDPSGTAVSKSITASNAKNYFARGVNVVNYGATGDGVTDDTAAIQAALTYGTENGVPVYIPAGTYVITSTLFITDQTQYKSAFVYGDGSGYDAAFHTKIDATAVLTDPALCITAGRRVTIQDMTIVGPNVAPGAIAPADIEYAAAWVTAGVRDSRYSPQCAIGMDANAGTAPTGPYPNLTYTGDSRSTFGLTLNRLNIYNNVVGVMLNPGLNLNGDFININDCDFINNKCSIAAGQAQTKGTKINNCGFRQCRTIYEGLEYGQQQGRGPLFNGSQCVRTYELVNWSAAFGPAVFTNFYGESLLRIGYGGVTDTLNSGISFYGCDIHLQTDGAERSPIVYEGKTGSFNYYGGRFGSDVDQSKNNVSYTIISKNTTFDGTSLEFDDRYRPLIHGDALMQHPVQLRNCRATDDSGSPALYYGKETTVGSNLSGRVNAHHTHPRIIVTPYASTSIAYDYVNTTEAGDVVAPGTSSSFSFGASTMTFDNTDAAGSFLIGDIIYWRMLAQGDSVSTYIIPALRVTTVSAPTVTCEYLYRKEDYDETYSPTSSNYIAVSHWAPGEALTGDTNSNTSLTNVSPIDILRNGDWIMAAAGIPANCRVVSGGGTATITLSRAATDTAVGKALWWDRLHTATTTAAF